MDSGFVAALVVAAVSAGGFMVNEASHGAMAQGMGLGHHHLSDVGGYHCADHQDAAHGARHVQHMHEETRAAHGSCPGGVQMHSDGGMMNG